VTSSDGGELMAETKPIQIFLCHASEDKAAVLDIYGRLQTLGYKPWLDKRDLLPGQRWRSEIPKAIRASDYILICLSKTSVAKRGYVQKEFKLALEVLDEMPAGAIYAIPLRLDDCAVPDQFSNLHWYNLFEADGFQYLLRALQAGRPPLQEATAPTLPTPLVPVTPRLPYEPEMILIQAGEFPMGSDPQKDKDAQDNEQPQHILYLPDYWLAKTPVTNAQYATFVQAVGWQAVGSKWTGDWAEGKSPPGKADHPVDEVTRDEAMAYCRWLSGMTGKAYSLPSEAEWEKGARGTDGRIYPWGNQWNATRCNTHEGGKRDTTSVGTYPQGASPYGLLDMAGNMWEWTRSLWGEYPYPSDAIERARREDRQAPNDQARVLRGGAFHNVFGHVRCTYRGRFSLYSRSRRNGFRVVVRP
jgi:formylglycine-generating enzyme required for sulfatase activity